MHLPPAVLAAGVIVVTVWMIGFVNAFNFMDGVNGISGAHAMIGGAAYACLGWLRPDPFLAAAGAAVAAGALAFLPWNAVRARVFLGDAGSYGLGCRPGRARGVLGDPRHPGRGRARPVRPVPRGHRVDAAAADPGRRAHLRGPPDAHLPATV